MMVMMQLGHLVSPVSSSSGNHGHRDTSDDDAELRLNSANHNSFDGFSDDGVSGLVGVVSSSSVNRGHRDSSDIWYRYKCIISASTARNAKNSTKNSGSVTIHSSHSSQSSKLGKQYNNESLGIVE